MILWLIAWGVCLAALAGLLLWQHRTILRLLREAARDNHIKVRLREELVAQADRHGESVPIVAFLGMASDKPIARWETVATPSREEAGDGR